MRGEYIHKESTWISVDVPCTVNIAADVAAPPAAPDNVVNGAIQSISDTGCSGLCSPRGFFAGFCLGELDVDGGSGCFRWLALLTAGDSMGVSARKRNYLK
jgi:hypothetical protein